jgi:hypothetical protein
LNFHPRCRFRALSRHWLSNLRRRLGSLSGHRLPHLRCWFLSLGRLRHGAKWFLSCDMRRFRGLRRRGSHLSGRQGALRRLRNSLRSGLGRGSCRLRYCGGLEDSGMSCHGRWLRSGCSIFCL